MAAPEEIARAHQQRHKSIILATIAAILGLWRRIDQDRLTESWQAGVGPSIVEVMARAQLEAAALAPGYLAELAAAQGIPPSGLEPVAAAFSGIASDGRLLETLLYQPIILFKRLLSGGASPEEAMRQATAHMAMIAATQAADAGRGAVNVGMTATREWVTYVRVVSLPACSRCIILAGRTYSHSTGFQRHPNCFPAGTTVSGPGARAATRRWYEGELVILRTAGGQELSATGNHPILTDRGWIAANLLQPGDHVVRSVLSEGAVPLVVPDERQMPARIEDLWRPDGVGRLVRMPTTSKHFHGDGGYGDVDVVFSDGLLRYGTEPAHVEPIDHLLLAGARTLADPFTAESVLAKILVGAGRSANGVVRSGGLGAPFLGGHLGCAHLTGFGSVADLDTLSDESLAQNVATHPQALADAVFALAGSVGVGDFLRREIVDGPGSSPRWDALGGQGEVEMAAADARRGLDLLNRLTGQVELDRVVETRRVDWSGHVYNLTSAEGWYAANSLIVSNCDCTMMPIRSNSDIESIASPMELFDQMSPEEQDRRFGKAGAEAIRLGGDMGQIVNARRGMQTAGGKLITTEGTTVRGVAGRRLGAFKRLPGERYRRSQVVRPMPEQLLADAGGDREEAIRLLERFGYLRDPRRDVRAQPALAVPQPRQPAEQVAEPVQAPSAPYHRSLDGIEDLARSVEDPRPPLARRVLTGGVSAVTELLTLADGTQVVRKSGVTADVPDALDAEHAVSLVARAFGLRAPRVYRNSPDAIWMEYVSDALTADELRTTDQAQWEARTAAALDRTDDILIGLVDEVASNKDRNAGNWMLTADGESIPIDHGHAYTILSDDLETYLPVPEGPVRELTGEGPFAEAFKGGSNPLTPADVDEARRRLHALRPDFTHLGRDAWLDYSLAVLDKLEPEARGFGSVFGLEPS